MLDGYVITLINHKPSVKAAERLKQSVLETNSDINVATFKATTPDQVELHIKSLFNPPVKWTYPYPKKSADYHIHNPWFIENGGARKDKDTNLRLTAYATANPNARLACSLSHMRIWRECVYLDKPLVVFEHDALVTRQFLYTDFKQILDDDDVEVIGLNNPHNATFSPGLFDKIVKEQHQSTGKMFVDCPMITRPEVPQGLAGNSAYLIKPQGAKRLLQLTEQHGIWPNDAIMCQQLMKPQSMKVVYPYISKVQGTQSTTTAKF